MDMKLIALNVLVRDASGFVCCCVFFLFFFIYCTKRECTLCVSKYERWLDNKAVCLYDRGFV